MTDDERKLLRNLMVQVHTLAQFLEKIQSTVNLAPSISVKSVRTEIEQIMRELDALGE